APLLLTKLSKAQYTYITIEIELLSIVETVKEFHSVPLGAGIHFFTDDKYLTFCELNTQCALHQQNMFSFDYSIFKATTFAQNPYLFHYLPNSAFS
ncbi:hypothetical protein ACHAW6_009705, partial [Cyclotella cf. meneghiniana]